MGRPPLISESELRECLELGLTIQEIADELGVSKRTVNNAKSRLGLTKDYFDHSELIPWSVSPKDKRSTEYQYLWRLSYAAQGGNLAPRFAKSAFTWAESAMREGRDIDYVEGEGFVWKSAGMKEMTTIRRAYEAAKRRAEAANRGDASSD